MINEQIACFFEQIAHLLIFLQKMSDSLGKPMSEFPALVEVRVYSLKMTVLSYVKVRVYSLKMTVLSYAEVRVY